MTAVPSDLRGVLDRARRGAGAWWFAAAVTGVLLGLSWSYRPGTYLPGIPLISTYCDADGFCTTYTDYTSGYYTQGTVLHGTQLGIRLFLVAAILCCVIGAASAARPRRGVVLGAGVSLVIAVALTVSYRQSAYALILVAALWAIWPAVAGERPWLRRPATAAPLFAERRRT